MPRPNSAAQMYLTDISPTDAAWAAGFIEGDGCIAISKAASYRFVYLVVSQSEPGKATLDELKRVFGGSTYMHLPSTQTFAGNYPMWEWHLQSQSQVRRCLEAILPFMHHPVKKDRAQLALQLLSRVLKGKQRFWMPEEDAFLRHGYKRGNAKAMAIKLGRTVQAITSRTVVLGLSGHPHKPSLLITA